MSTYNGEKYLPQQIDSVLAQEGVNVSLLVRDDGSSDKTREILNKYNKEGKLTWYGGENIKPALSFMDLIFKASDSDFYAFCDQDDVWDGDKLKIAIQNILPTVDIPSLYISATRVVNKDLTYIRDDRKKGFNFTFEESLFRNPATGCTMVFNRLLFNIVKMYKPDFLIMHDSWIYRICFAIEGKVIFDSEPHISYRQHGDNVIGASQKTFLHKLRRRMNYFLKGSTNERLLQIKYLYDGFSHLMTDVNKIKLIEDLLKYRKSFKSKMSVLFNHNITTNSLEGRCAIFMVILLNRF